MSSISSKRAHIHVLQIRTRGTTGLRFQIDQFHGFASGEMFMKLSHFKSSQIGVYHGIPLP